MVKKWPPTKCKVCKNGELKKLTKQKVESYWCQKCGEVYSKDTWKYW